MKPKKEKSQKGDMPVKPYQRIYSLLFFSSLLLFLVNYIIQGQLLFTYFDYYGIIFKMGWAYWLGYILLLILVSYHYTNFEHIDSRYVYLSLFLMVTYFIATPFLYESLPRFEDTWGHSFLAQEIFGSKRVNIGISIYEQYPGSILFYGLLFHFIPSYYVMKFFPPLFYYVGILVVYVLFKELFSFKGTSNAKIAFLIPIIYMFFNWTVEDNHISPQFLILNLYFLFMLLSVKFLYGEKDRKKYFVALTLLGTVIVLSHPFTPIFLLFILASVYVLCKELRARIIPIAVMLAAIFVVHSMYYTTIFDITMDYSKNFIDVLMHGLKFESVAHRLESTIVSRQVFLSSRIGITLMSVILGLAGAVVMRTGKDKATKKTTANFLLGWSFSLVPFLLFVALAVRGEFYERFALISSLPLAALTVYLFNEYEINFSTLLIFLLLLSPFYFIGKYGNEAFESVSVEKLMANCFSYEFYSRCAEDFRIVDSPLNYDIENLNKFRFVTSREEIMAGVVFNNKDIESVSSLIYDIVEEYKLHRIYSTSEASVFIQ